MKLKNPAVCRIFFSSPFGGMEGEREELTRRYFPQIQSLCNSKGIQFVAVDMRWGITAEASGSAQVISICLQELDRSDVFVGFFGQRYGWNGSEDEALQKNFNNALPKYPWLDDVRDRSVTELEFLGGHLNQPGLMPACIYFRNKAYDDKMCCKSKGDKKVIYKYSSESANSTLRMQDLKDRVESTKDKLIGLDMSYNTPEDGAKSMFDAIWKLLTLDLLAAPTELSKYDMELANHDAFLATYCRLYVGGQQYFSVLDNYIKNGKGGLLVQGGPGSGKSSLLCNWMKEFQRKTPEVIVVYHFIGCSKESLDIGNILDRLIKTLEKSESVDISEKKPGGANVESNEDDSNRALVLALQNKLSELVKQKKKILILIDGLDKIKLASKKARMLYWLPKVLESVNIIVSTTSRDTARISELIDEREYERLSVEALSQADKADLCVKTLKESGKELSPHQFEIVMAAPQTDNPLFLKVMLQELCMFGNFWKLDKKIQDLLDCQSIEELFGSFLERLEADYDSEEYQGNVVEQVVCVIYASYLGLSEEDICNMLKIPSHIWSPLYFGLEKVLHNRNGKLKFAYDDLIAAVNKKYLLHVDENRNRYIEKLARHFTEQLKTANEAKGRVSHDIYQELPWLWHQAHRKIELQHFLMDLNAVKHLFTNYPYHLLEYWQYLDMDEETMANLYIGQIDLLVADTYIMTMDSYADEMVITEIQNVVQTLRQFFALGGWPHAEQMINKRGMRLIENKMSCDNSSKLRLEYYQSQYHIATCYTSTTEYDKSTEVYTKLIKQLEETDYEKNHESRELLSRSLHGLGVLYLSMRMYDEAEKYLLESQVKMKNISYVSRKLEIENKSTCIQNLATVYLQKEMFDKAIEGFKETLELLEDASFSEVQHGTARVLTNLGLCYRRSNQLDLAEEMYHKSLDMKVALMGWYHTDTAMALQNLGVVHQIREDASKADEYFQKAQDILEKTEDEDSITLIMIRENIANNLLNMGKVQEAEEAYWKAYTYLNSRDRWEYCLPFLTNRMVDILCDTKRSDKAVEVLTHILPTSWCQDIHYCRFNYLGGFTAYPEFSLDQAMQRFPDSIPILCIKIKRDSIPNKNTKEILEITSKLVDLLADQVPVLAETLSSLAGCCDDTGGMLDVGEQIMKVGKDKVPEVCQEKPFLFSFGVTLAKQKKYEEAFPYMKQLMELKDNNWQHCMVSSQVSLYANEVEYGKSLLQNIAENCPDEDMKEKAKKIIADLFQS